MYSDNNYLIYCFQRGNCFMTHLGIFQFFLQYHLLSPHTCQWHCNFQFVESFLRNQKLQKINQFIFPNLSHPLSRGQQKLVCIKIINSFYQFCKITVLQKFLFKKAMKWRLSISAKLLVSFMYQFILSFAYSSFDKTLRLATVY